ncbi:MAG: bifunctional hydroxymethylpyrimidine kinase/phosphomethylpyrimidine kinase [Alphaproteobacteria bacterium]|nr:bifunctional hydroxymethylpyrimidine kinase/phosphomethylpyrimidine kinase [Alphaproteobacteria bacterium]MDX5369791.1 bifunctional hydroxymethylpyrimidine kinase/phosphomethylpyrimidine kinase [Alphaproteobacteria bacterium]MDX5464415.1 bifunctional hydroxymethylpyrimidine kinase/phosphomethylpyrimidine kinase [Alphaproteobacteria bacterium]
MTDGAGAHRGRVLIVAGSDSGGGAGIQADIKAVTALGGYAMTAVTAITVQDTTGVHGVHPIPLDVVRGQIAVTMDDIGADAVKTGMLGTVETIETVAAALDAHRPDADACPLVADPVMVAKGGAPLLEDRAVGAVRDLILPRAALVTPNAPEAERLTGIAVGTLDGQRRAAEALMKAGAAAALVKGGHVPGDTVRDLLMTAHGEHVFEAPRIASRSTHGTGCTTASAIACGLALGQPLDRAVGRAIAYVRRAIELAPGFGKGHGPLWHGWTVDPSRVPDKP